MSNLSARSKGLLAINIAAVIFGSAALFGKLDVSPFWIVDMRAAFAALALLILGFFRKDLALPSPRQAIALFFTGAILALHWLTFFAAVRISGIAVATLTFAAFPLFTVLIGNIRQRQYPAFAEIAAGVAIIVAVGLLVNPYDSIGDWTGAASGLVSAFTFACFGHAGKHLGQSLSTLRISLYQNSVVAILLLPFLFFVSPAPSQLSDWLWLMMLGVVTTALMHQLYLYALQRLSASTCSGFVALEPVYAILFAAAIFNEAVTFTVAISAVLIVGASFALLRMESRTA